MTPLKAVLFDVDDTLFSTTDFAKKARRNAVKAMIQYGLDVKEEVAMSELGEVLKEFSSNYDHHFDKLLTRLSGPAKNATRRAMIVGAGVVAYHDTKFKGLLPFPDVKPLLTGLAAAKVAVGVITHGWTGKQTEKLIRLGLMPNYFAPENVFISDAVGISKPNPKLYSTALESMGLIEDPGAVMYVGDNPAHDVTPAKGIGMRTAWCRRASKFDTAEVAPDHEVQTLAQLGDILGEVYGIPGCHPQF